MYNAQGDVVGLADSSGKVVVEYTYDAWGNPLSITGTLASTLGQFNPLRYRGYVWDGETGLFYVNSRYYNPSWGRFISADNFDTLNASPMELTDKNVFAYCDNNPVMRADSDGEFWHIIGGAFIGGLIGGIASVVEQAVSGQEINWAKVGTAFVAGAITGAVAATGAGLLVQVAVGAGVAMAEDATNQVIKNNGFNDFDVGSTLASGVGGAVGGLVGGKGVNGKALATTVTNANKIISRQTTKAAAGAISRTGAKQITRYAAKKAAVRTAVIVSTARYAASTITNKLVTNTINTRRSNRR